MTTPTQLIRKTLHQMGIVNLRGHLQFIKRRGIKYSPIFGYEAIPGWLSENEAITLYELARSLPADHPVAVEIGSWLGKSSVVLSKGLRGKKRPALYCIDPFNGDADASDRQLYGREMVGMDRTLEQTFLDNMKKNGVLDIARPGRTWLSVTLADFSAATVVRAVEELTEKYDELERAHVALGAEETKVRFG